MRKTQILLADDHAVLRAGLRAIISAELDLEVVGEAATVLEAVEKAITLGPDVLVLDLNMPGGDSLSIIRAIRAAHWATRVLILTMHEDIGFAHAALAAGANGYVVKTIDAAELLAAIREVHRGESFVFVDAGGSSVTLTLPKVNKERGAPTASPLTEREQQVLRLLVDGYTNRQIAEQLYLSVKTIESHRARLMQKLGLRSRADLVRYVRGE